MGARLNLERASSLAVDGLREHGLDGWTFRLDRARQRAGACFYRARRISLSRHFIENNDESEVLDTIRHEVAHALAWEHGRETGHGAAWKRWCTVTGASPRRCYAEEIVMPEPRYQCTVLAAEVAWSTGSWVNKQTGIARTRLEKGTVFGRHRLTEKLRAAVKIGMVAVLDTQMNSWVGGRRAPTE
jgi:predicted SprT family Zn-dependent metalloprotease